MKKRISVFMLVIYLTVLALPFSAFAYSGGILSGKTIYVGANGNMTGTGNPRPELTDGLENTGYSMDSVGSYDTIWVALDSPTTLTSYKIKADGPAGAFKLKFYDSNGTHLASDFNPVLDATLTAINIPNVSKIVMSVTNIGYSVFEMDFNISLDTTPPTKPTGLTATTANGQAVLSWTAATDNVGVTSYNIYRDGVKVGTSAGTSYTAAGLSNNVTYSWTVSALDARANESPQSDATTSNNFADVAAPDKPTGLTATPSNGQAVLSWTAATDNVGVTGYSIYRDGTKIGTASGTSYTATGLSNNVTYSWTVSAYDSAGNDSLRSDPANTMFDTVSPLAPIGLTVDSAGSGYVNLKWTPNTEPDLAGYNAYADSVKNNGSLIPIASYKVTGLSDNHMYTLQVTAVDNSGNESAKSDSVTFLRDSQPPGAPTAVNISAISGNGVIHWTGPADTDINGYNVYDQTGAKLNNTLISGTSYTTAPLIVNHNYSFQVSAVDTSGNESAKSTPTQVFMYTEPGTTPGGGTGLGSIVGLNWGFQASDIVTNSVWIIGALAAFVLLGLAIGRISPIISLVREAIKKS
jgi:chitodextrinase